MVYFDNLEGYYCRVRKKSYPRYFYEGTLAWQGNKMSAFPLLPQQSVNVRVHIHRFQHHSLCLRLHHCITNVLVSCLCNFRQPTGSFHLLNWSKLPVLKLASCFLESRLFSPLFFFSHTCCSRVPLRCHREAVRGHQPQDNSPLLLLKTQILSRKCRWNPLVITFNLISLSFRRTPARLQMADGTPLPPNATATLGNSSGRPPVPICDSQNGRGNSQDQSAILYCFCRIRRFGVMPTWRSM